MPQLDQIPTPRTDAEWAGYVRDGLHDAGEHYARKLERETVVLRDALRAIRTLKPTNMSCDHWSREMGLVPDEVFDLCDAALAQTEVKK